MTVEWPMLIWNLLLLHTLPWRCAWGGGEELHTAVHKKVRCRKVSEWVKGTKQPTRTAAEWHRGPTQAHIMDAHTVTVMIMVTVMVTVTQAPQPP